MKGLKYRTVGLATDIMQGMGVKVTQLPGGEIVPALERGVIEAFEFNNPTSDREFGAQDVRKVYMMGSYHQAAEFFEIIFNKDKFDSLPKEHQAILEYSAEAASPANYALAMDQLFKGPAEADQQGWRQGVSHAGIRHGGPVEVLGQSDSTNSTRTPSSRRW